MRSDSFDMLRAMASRPASFDQACGKNRELRWTDKVEAEHCQAEHALLAEQRAFPTAIIGLKLLLGIASFPHRSLGSVKKTNKKTRKTWRGYQQDELREGTKIIYHIIRPASPLPCGYARNRTSSRIQHLSPSGFAELGENLLS